MQFIIRAAQPEDACKIIPYVHRLTEEKGILIAMSAGEFTKTEVQEATILQEFSESENSIYLVAEKDGTLFGILTAVGGHRKTTRHVVSVSMSVAHEYRHQGVGYALMEACLNWAKQNPVVNRVELLVFANNEPAISLYRKFGFVEEGRHKHAILLDGAYLDNLSMAVLV